MNIERLSALKTHFAKQQSLYAIMDAATDPKILDYFSKAESKYDTYFPNAQAQNLMEYVPYLVDLKEQTILLDQLLTGFWQKNTGLYLLSDASFEALLMHLNSITYVEFPDGLKYFRFHDPRILPNFLLGADTDTLRQFFGPIHSFILESEDEHNLLSFSLNETGLVSKKIRLNTLSENTQENTQAAS